MFDALSALNHYKQYMEVRHLGGGLQGRAVLLRSPDGTDSVVSKQTTVVGIGANELARIEREVRILSSLNHPHIIAYRCCFQRDELLCIMTEYAGGGTLRREIRQRAAAGVGEGATSATSAPSSRLAVPHSAHLTDGRILVWMAQLASALHAVHAAGALHRDLKPENIFLTTTADIKLGDFGLSRNVIMGTEETIRRTASATDRVRARRPRRVRRMALEAVTMMAILRRRPAVLHITWRPSRSTDSATHGRLTYGHWAACYTSY